MKKIRRIFALLLVATLASCGSSDSGEGSQTDPEASAPSAPPSIPEVALTIDDSGVVFEAEVTAQPTKLVVSNTGKDPHQVYLAGLNEGVGESDVQSAVKKGPGALFPLITIAGSFPGEGKNFARVSPGASDELTIDFPEGTYMVIDPESKGTPFGIFDIVAHDGEEAAEPEADYTIEAGDFYFKVEEATAGPAVVKIVNAGEQAHEVSLAIPAKGGGEPEEGAFAFTPPPGGAMWTEFDLEAGTYEAKCYFEDPETKKPHFELGMVAEFEVAPQ